MSNRSDNFNRADTTNAIGTPSDGGSAWSQFAGTWGINSSQAYCSASQSQATCALQANTSILTVQVTWSTVGSDCGVIARAADANNYILYVTRAGAFNDVIIYKRVGGSFTQLATTSGTAWVNGDTMAMSIDGSNLITGYRNSVAKLTVTDASLSSNTMGGMRDNDGNANSRFDDFSITDNSGGATTPIKIMFPAPLSGVGSGGIFFGDRLQ